MTAFNQRVTQIKGLSDRRRLPRLGIIRLGLKVKNSQGKEYPKETEHFVVPPEVAAVYGDTPTELDVMFPLNEIDAVFPQAYKFYGSSKGLKCQGNGETAYCVDENKEMVERTCPCEMFDKGKCKQTGVLMVMLPRVNVGGVYQIRTSSVNSIIDINSGLDYVAALLGRFAMVPLRLRRVKTETHHDEKTQNHYTMQVIFDADINTINLLRSDTQRVLEHPRYALPAPVEENPELDPVDVLDDEEGAAEQTQGAQEDVSNFTPTPEATISQGHVRGIRGMMKENGLNEKAFLAAFGIGKIEDLPESKQGDAIKWLTR